MTFLVPCLVGPTAAGKTRAAVQWARKNGGVVLSADSRQVYPGLDVATGKEGTKGEFTLPGMGKVPAFVLDGVVQIGVDLASADERFTAARWLAFARPAIEALARAGIPPVVVGGTGLYVEALLRGFDFPATDPRARRSAALSVPAAARPWRRHVRQAELKQLGLKPSRRPAPWRFQVVAIDPPRPLLREAMEARIRGWFDSGALLEEARLLLASGLSSGAPAFTAIGYAEALQVLRYGLSPKDAAQNMVRRTWAYSRRQRTYFRNRLPEAAWVDDPTQALTRLAVPQLQV